MNLMFQPQFEPMILSGRKPHTVRPTRKRPLQDGTALSLRVWTDKPYRSKQREFAKATVYRTESIIVGHKTIILGCVVQNPDEADRFAHADGFYDAEAMRKWFDNTHGLPFVGTVIHFKLIP